MGRTRARYCKGITCIDTIGLQKLQDSSNHGLKNKIFFLIPESSKNSKVEFVAHWQLLM